MGKTYGWEVYDYLISQTAQNPEDDYTLELNIVPSVAFGRENTGNYGKRFGVKEPIKRYIEVADRISQQLGYEVIKYMGIKPDLSGYTGVEVESPVLPGRYDLGNTKRAELTGKKLGSGMTLLNTLEDVKALPLPISSSGATVDVIPILLRIVFISSVFKTVPVLSLAISRLKVIVSVSFAVVVCEKTALEISRLAIFISIIHIIF